MERGLPERGEAHQRGEAWRASRAGVQRKGLPGGSAEALRQKPAGVSESLSR